MREWSDLCWVLKFYGQRRRKDIPGRKNRPYNSLEG